MKATGVVRRIDELGRIVVPKEIRRTLRIREGDSLEIFIDGKDIMLKKYSHVEAIDDVIMQYVDAVYASTRKEIVVVDTENVIAASGNFRKDIIGKKINIKLDEAIQKRTTQVFDKNIGVEICDGVHIRKRVILKPIIVYGDVYGAVVVASDNFVDEIEKVIAETTASFITKTLEN